MRYNDPRQPSPKLVRATDFHSSMSEKSQHFVHLFKSQHEKQEALKWRIKHLEFRIELVMEIIRKTKAEWGVV